MLQFAVFVAVKTDRPKTDFLFLATNEKATKMKTHLRWKTKENETESFSAENENV